MKQFLDIVIETLAPLSATQLIELQRRGLHLLAALDAQRYRLRGESENSAESFIELPFVTAVTVSGLEEKANAVLRATATRAAATLPLLGTVDPLLTILIDLDEWADIAAIVSALAQLGTIEQQAEARILLSLPLSKLAQVAALPAVIAVEEQPDNRTQNNVARNLIGLTIVSADLGLDGSGEIVGVADSGLDVGVTSGSLLADFAGRVVNIRASVNKAALAVADGADLNNHGTHVCGSIAGDGSNSNSRIQGMAPAAQLTVLSMGPNNSSSLTVPLNLRTGVLQPAYSDGARLHNNSWGSRGSAGSYTTFARDVDRFVWDNPDMLPLIAAGNEGPMVSTVTAPGTAKNCLTVGAAESVRPLPGIVTLSNNFQDDDFNPTTPPQNVPLSLSNFDDQADNFDDVADFSGRGPTRDGRIKPEIVAPGTWILSCRSSISTADLGPDGLPPLSFYADDADGIATHDEAVGRGLPGGPIFGAWDQAAPQPPNGAGTAARENYFYNSGTSMATPIAAGALALIRQYLRERRGVINPSAALLKALVINGATVAAGESNTPNNSRGFGRLDLATTLTPPATGAQAFIDDPSLAVSSGDVRRFTVQVADPGHPLRITLSYSDMPGVAGALRVIQNQLYLRLIAPDGARIDGDLTPFPTVSNNVQRIHIGLPQAGSYTIEVHGVAVVNPLLPQPFALAMCNVGGFAARPADIVQILDQSQSMATYGYAQPVVQRAKQAVDLAAPNDRIGVVAFGESATLAQPLTNVTQSDGRLQIKRAIDLLATGGRSAIGAGLQAGLAELALNADRRRKQTLLLLSDGHENRPPWVGGAANNSPPAWFDGADRTQILPTAPPDVAIHTVGLGIQSDLALLQTIAHSTGGSFHALFGPADSGRLHEILIHIQALAAGEAVIISDESEVTGLQANGVPAPGAALRLDDPALAAVLATLRPLKLNLHNGDLLRELQSTRQHAFPVDESVKVVTCSVSWHDLQAPVTMRLISPSQQVILPTTTTHATFEGETYQTLRITNPEPGEWQLVVRRVAQQDHPGLHRHCYTYAVVAETPFSLQVTLPNELDAGELPIKAELLNGEAVARTIRFSSTMDAPLFEVDQLLAQHERRLRKLDVDIKPDSPTVPVALFRLPLLDQQLRDLGKQTLFRRTRRTLNMTRNNDYTATFRAKKSGVHSVRLALGGTSRAGFSYRRQLNVDILIGD